MFEKFGSAQNSNRNDVSCGTHKQISENQFKQNPLQISMTSKNYLLLLHSKTVSKVKFPFLNIYFVPGKVSAFKRIHFKKGKWNLRK